MVISQSVEIDLLKIAVGIVGVPDTEQAAFFNALAEALGEGHPRDMQLAGMARGLTPKAVAAIKSLAELGQIVLDSRQKSEADAATSDLPF